MRICEECMHEEFELEEDQDSPFPVFTILGGLLGAATSLITGVGVTLIPIWIMTGLAADIANCELCGSEENVFQTASEEEAEDGKAYTPIDSLEGLKNRDPSKNSQSDNSPKTGNRYDRGEALGKAVRETSVLADQEQKESKFDWTIMPETPSKASIDQKERLNDLILPSASYERIASVEENKIDPFYKIKVEDPINGEAEVPLPSPEDSE